MSTNALKNQLIMFLRSYGILGEFMSNFEKKSEFTSIMEMCDSVPQKDIMRSCFKWADTEEGYDFWKRYHAIWSNSNPKMFCIKPDDYMTTIPIGGVINHELFGELIVTETKSSCAGCAFYKKNKECANGKRYACTPYSRGDMKSVIFKKKLVKNFCYLAKNK